MKALIFILATLFCVGKTAAQKLQCGCSTEPAMTGSVSNCKISTLKNGSKLYYQFNCDSVWLTLERPGNKKTVLYSMTGNTYKELYSYNFRLGYQFSREYQKYLLFRSGCAANGPCNFILVDKNSGRTVKQLGELIYDHSSNKFYDFLLYLTNKNKQYYLVIYYPDNNRRRLIPMKHLLQGAYAPEYEVDDVEVKNDNLILKYSGQTLKVSLKNRSLEGNS